MRWLTNCARSVMVESINAQVQTLSFEARAMQSKSSQQLNQISEALEVLQTKIDTIKFDKDETEISSDDIVSLTTRVSQLSLTTQKYANEHVFLTSLHYSQRPVRHENITEAHRTTFSWTLSDVEACTGESSGLVEWLKGGDGIFWLSGRPGSGKSTLMKFVADHQKTDSLLSLWANDGTVIKACHYFWSPGSEIQRSNEGLLRSLLYDILSQNSELIRIVCPDRWLHISSSKASIHIPWSPSELQSTFSKIASQTQLPVKICFFIDGLDEFSGDHLQLCESLIELSRCAGIKLLVSSRQWNVFEDSFGKNPTKMLRLHELTERDIRNYTESQLFEHPNWKSLESEAGRGQAISLVTDITFRSRGVFLWVYLVTRMLRDGLTNYDTLSDLQSRLEGIPTNLGNFFKIILESVEPFYHKMMAGTLSLALTAKGPLPVIIYSFHDLEYKDHNYAIKEKVEPWSRDRLSAFQGPFSRRLSSRCKGLLEVQGEKVEFLHRTVRDFLRNAEMRDYIASKLSENFNPSLSIFRAYVAWTKHKSFFGRSNLLGEDPDHQEHFCPIMDDVLYYARDDCAGNNMATWDLLDDLELSTNIMFDTPDYGNDNDLPNDSACSRQVSLYRHRVLQAGLAGYIEMKLEQDSRFLAGLQVPPLAVVFGLDRSLGGTAKIDWFDQRVKLVNLLLVKGMNPNQSYNCGVVSEDTPWFGIFSQLMQAKPSLVTLDNGVIFMLLKFGANPNAVSTSILFTGFGAAVGTMNSLPIWVQFLAIVFSTNQIEDHAEAYIQVLAKMLDKADFDASSSEAIRLDDQIFDLPQAAINKGTITMRAVGLSLIRSSLRQMDSRRTVGIYYSLPHLQVIAKSIIMFLTHAAHPSLDVTQIRRDVLMVFPSSLSNCLLTVLRNNYPDKKPKCQKRKSEAQNSGRSKSVKRK